MTPAEIRTHLRYSGWASQRLFDAAKKLNPDDLTRNTGVSHESILGTLSHIHFADRIWYSRVVDANEPPLPAKVKPTQAVHFAESLAKGTKDWQKIAATVAKDRIRELV